MKKIVSLLFLVAISWGSHARFSTAYHLKPVAHKKTSGIDKSRILIGPGFGFGVAQRAFSISLTPSVAYCLTTNFHVGTTLGFNYYQEAFDYKNLLTGMNETYKLRVPSYSLSVYARYIAFDRLILNFEPEINNTKYITSSSFSYNTTTGKLQEKTARPTISSVIVSAGYAQRFSTYGYSYVLIGYDLVQNPNSRYYQTLDYKVGIMISPWSR